MIGQDTMLSVKVSLLYVLEPRPNPDRTQTDPGPNADQTWTESRRNRTQSRRNHNSDFNYILGVNRKLIIKKADFDDDGVYEARLPSGTSKAKLSISERVITVEEPLKDLQVPIEGDAIFETVLNCMNAEPAWTKNGQPIKRGPQCQVEEEPHKKGGLYRMTLKACALGDDAKVGFSCAGDQCRQSASFEVMDLPLGFTKELKDIETVEYTPSVTFECHTTRQGASATWYANGRPVEDGGKYNIVSRKFVRKLVVNDLSKKDNYPIKCRITDKGDSAETSGKLATSKTKAHTFFMNHQIYIFYDSVKAYKNSFFPRKYWFSETETDLVL